MLGSYVFTDPKGELYDKTAGFLKANGYEIKVLNLLRPQNSDGYNPLMHISNELDVDVIASTIIKGQGEASASEPFWEDMGEMLLKSLIYYLIATRPEEEQNLASCAELVRAASGSGNNSMLSDLINKLPMEHPSRKYYKSVEISAASEKTYSSILSTLQSKLGKFDSKEIAELTSTNTIDFEEIGKKKTAVYVISSDTHTAYDFLLTIFFSQMIQQLYDFADVNGGALPMPTYFILDEFANIGKVPDFDKKISTSRSRKIQFSVILQNLDQLEAVYEKSFETIIGNCDTHLFLGSNSQKTVEKYKADHNEARDYERGEWRTFNPYNPYTEEGEQQVNDLKIDSLDDLFSEEEPKQEKTSKKQNSSIETHKESQKAEIEDIPMLPQEEIVENKELDIAKEFDEIFDEIFGPVEETDTAKKS